ncbi:MAG: hypothetical protein K9J16_15840 [Melioribacteraceae bacterium]|nr:hypothetical protein [Melioribacteraceae bacterium]MCF8356059.1 hypothetical protein [Melioribacteraceae bacterium]MCF8394886.1 hypothetical protein [Melioribacteraceae bacterium]MCF8420419.1 hypothetical protein [Melioribacteraceae bacterium]
MNEELANKIIAVAYGDAPVKDKIRIYFLSLKDSEVKKMLNDYKATAAEVHSLGLDECPPEIIERVKSKTKLPQHEEKSFFYDIYFLVFKRPALSVGVMSLIVLMIISSLFIERPEIREAYTKRELAVADKQAREALMFVSNIFSKTETTVKEDVLRDKVSEPINKSFKIVNSLLNVGGQNEKSN